MSNNGYVPISRFREFRIEGGDFLFYRRRFEQESSPVEALETGTAGDVNVKFAAAYIAHDDKVLHEAGKETKVRRDELYWPEDSVPTNRFVI